MSAIFNSNHEKPLIMYHQNGRAWIGSVLSEADRICYVFAWSQCDMVSRQSNNAVASCNEISLFERAKDCHPVFGN